VYVSDVYSYFYLLDGQDIQSGVKVEEIQLVGQETISDDTFFDYLEDTLMGQAVLPHLSDGNHNMTVFIGQAKDDGTIQPANIDPFSFTVNFSVDTTTPPSPSPEATETPLNSDPSPTTFVAASAAIVATGSGLSIAYYIRKKKNSKHPTPP
jgi:hypothetical protein